ncbi:MAG: NapC/NirT family cytochrome c [Pyrinomonadaceae bacterium]|nr:NapC/NirT family cytochrome c [Pyrinomonadaceae bacterium]MBP6211560.1 NapC/NirT family cytochrome c [Pyrinomonadaceae bacterium]
MNDENEIKEEFPNEAASKMKAPSLLRNYVSFVGMAIALAAITSNLLLFFIEMTAAAENAYIGILTYIIIPSVMMFGLAIAGIGMFFERRRRRTRAPDDVMAYPMLDLNNPHTRRTFMVFMVGTLVFVSVSAFGSYKAFEYSESVTFCGETCHTVMRPQFMAHKAGAHARVRCVDCHVGSGADWYVRSKLSGAYQLYSVSFNKFSRPTTTPVHNLRPAPDTCEQCHWPEKFFGAQLKVLNRFANDEHNTLRQIRMLLNVGGGSTTNGRISGIHWHVDAANEVNYVSTDEQRQVIPWMVSKDRDGNLVEYFDRNNPPTQEQIATGNRRKMDCVDCHNRPAHNYLPPDVVMDNALGAGTIDATLPFIKRQGVAVLAGQYETTPQALTAIETNLNDFYRSNYPQVYTEKAQLIKNAVTEIQRLFQNYFFPEMRADWRTHPNNAGHINSIGCFRCHDGSKVTKTGKVLTHDCNVCHTVLYDSNRPAAENVQTGPFKHPVDLGALADRDCSSCHKADQPFKHPINLGDISMFQCAVCHTRKN